MGPIWDSKRDQRLIFVIQGVPKKAGLIISADLSARGTISISGSVCPSVSHAFSFHYSPGASVGQVGLILSTWVALVQECFYFRRNVRLSVYQILTFLFLSGCISDNLVKTFIAQRSYCIIILCGEEEEKYSVKEQYGLTYLSHVLLIIN